MPLILALGALGCGASDSEQKKPPRPLTVMTFNVLCSFCGGGDYDSWDERLPYFGDIFARHDPDLIGLQELTPLGKEVEQVLEQAPGRAALFYAPEDRPRYPDATILYRKSRFSLRERGEYWLSPTPDVPSSTGFADTQLPRLVVWARLFDSYGERELFFATTHFDNNSPSQELSAPLVMDRTLPFVETHPVIFNGDFNSRPESKAFAILSADSSRGFVFQDSHALAAEWHVVENQSPDPSYDLTTRIDHIFLAGSGDFRVSSWAADLSVYGPNQRYPSDHFPIVAVLDY